MKYEVTVNGDQTFVVEINQDQQLLVNGKLHPINFRVLDDTAYSLLIDNRSYEGLVNEIDSQYEVLIEGTMYQVQVLDEREQRLSGPRSGFAPDAGEVSIRAPMPGLIIQMLVKPGDEVEARQPLVILESMKMENELKAPRAGTVASVKAKAGDSVEQNKVLVTIT